MSHDLLLKALIAEASPKLKDLLYEATLPIIPPREEIEPICKSYVRLDRKPKEKRDA